MTSELLLPTELHRYLQTPGQLFEVFLERFIERHSREERREIKNKKDVYA
jgi:hypothetical protein